MNEKSMVPVNAIPFSPDWVLPPGESIFDVAEERGWTQVELAQRLGYTEKHLSQIINGQAPVTAEVAQQLERVLGSTVNFWLTLEANYQKRKVEKSMVSVDAVLRLLLDKAYTPTSSSYGDEQLVNGAWYSPVWGCDTLQYIVDGVRDLAFVEQKKSAAADFTVRVLNLIRRKDLHSTFYWKIDGDSVPLTFFLNCNDFFVWGCSDAEDITPDNIERLEKAIEECESIDSDDGAMIGCDLFVCRERGMRPQGACYSHFSEDRRFWPLFDACGPEREVGIGNPYAPGEAA